MIKYKIVNNSLEINDPDQLKEVFEYEHTAQEWLFNEYLEYKGWEEEDDKQFDKDYIIKLMEQDYWIIKIDENGKEVE